MTPYTDTKLLLDFLAKIEHIAVITSEQRICDCVHTVGQEIESGNLSATPPPGDGLLEAHEQWLVDRIEWLRKEAHGGGNWEHLKARMDESAYVLEKLRVRIHQERSAAIANYPVNAGVLDAAKELYDAVLDTLATGVPVGHLDSAADKMKASLANVGGGWMPEVLQVLCALKLIKENEGKTEEYEHGQPLAWRQAFKECGIPHTMVSKEMFEELKRNLRGWIERQTPPPSGEEKP